MKAVPGRPPLYETQLGLAKTRNLVSPNHEIGVAETQVDFFPNPSTRNRIILCRCGFVSLRRP